MKTSFCLWFFGMSFSLFAQPYPEPDFAEKPMYYNTATKQSMPIERQMRPFKEESAGFTQTFYYREPQSSFLIKKSEGVQFLIKLFNTVEPDLILFLYPLTPSKDSRLLKIHPLSKDMTQGLVPFQYHKVAENIYMLTVDTIEPGEYVWYLKSASYLFRVE